MSIAIPENAVAESPSEVGPSIGSFLDVAIPAWVKLSDGQYLFDGIAPGPRAGIVDMGKLKEGEVAIFPGLLYRRG